MDTITTQETLQMKEYDPGELTHDFVEVGGRVFRVFTTGQIDRWDYRTMPRKSDRDLFKDTDYRDLPERLWRRCRVKCYGTRREPVLTVTDLDFDKEGRPYKKSYQIKAIQVVAAAFFEGFYFDERDKYRITRVKHAPGKSLYPPDLVIYPTQYEGPFDFENNPHLTRLSDCDFIAMHKETGDYVYRMPGNTHTEPDTHRYIGPLKDAFFEKLAAMGGNINDVYHRSIRFNAADQVRWAKLNPIVADPAALPEM